MRTIATIAFLLLNNLSFGQNAEVDKIDMKVTANYKPATIDVIKGKVSLASIPTRGGKLKFKGLETAYYSFLISGMGQPASKTDSILVLKGQTLELMVTLDGPCLYDHPEGNTPTCPKNHTDNIIPIVYGLIGRSKDSKDEIYLGGCVVTDCDPKYYCKKHLTKF